MSTAKRSLADMIDTPDNAEVPLHVEEEVQPIAALAGIDTDFVDFAGDAFAGPDGYGF